MPYLSIPQLDQLPSNKPHGRHRGPIRRLLLRHRALALSRLLLPTLPLLPLQLLHCSRGGVHLVAQQHHPPPHGLQ